ncbi:Deoxyhypusine hydroxylase [Hibiscus syriacus]|uniref:Deoxyhypusine hydroxylase n=1 Tax=Hibiscus syriacus TaxID=106335 RepID=A0A6A2Z2L7_HIBSY|nr:Deoxyhypusine hydroxylase [Hibiscus syriacus]
MGSLDDGVSASGSSLSNNVEKFLCDRLLDPSQPYLSASELSSPFATSKALTLATLSFKVHALHNFAYQISRLSPFSNYFQRISTRDSSNLLAHEAAFALGQMQDTEAIPSLEAVLNDLSLHPIVRHEAAEALGAIGLESNIPLLKNSLVLDPAPEVRETCELALQRIEELKSSSSDDKSSMKETSPFCQLTLLQQLHLIHLEVLLDEERGMYERYSALFALRNHGGEEAVSAIIDSLESKVAYVLGQLQNKAASAALSNILRNVGEHPMVRHEAAEALGSIADDQSVALLKEFARDPEPIVSQSCEVALSMLEFERAGKSFEAFPLHANSCGALELFSSPVLLTSNSDLLAVRPPIDEPKPPSFGSIVGNNSVLVGFSSIHDDRVICLRHLPHHRVPCAVPSPPVFFFFSGGGGALGGEPVKLPDLLKSSSPPFKIVNRAL